MKVGDKVWLTINGDQQKEVGVGTVTKIDDYVIEVYFRFGSKTVRAPEELFELYKAENVS